MGKSCCDKKGKINKGKGKIDSFLASIVIITALILAGVVYAGSKIGQTSQVIADENSELTIGEESTYDWGAIDIDGGIVSKSFFITNSGDATLKLYDVKTSCMCTTAQLKTADQVSKKFSMHEKNSSVFEVKAGDTAELLVEFDPAFHGPSGTGPISRVITLNTNDSVNPELTYQLTAKVVKK